MKVSFGSLGGAGEIGMNMYIYETDNSALIVDCGVKFAKETDPGIDLMIPDFSYLDTIKRKNISVIVSHAHEDHIGALPFLLSEYAFPVAASKFSMDLIDYKLKERDISTDKIYLKGGEPVVFGDFTVDFIPVSHSIHGAGALLIKCGETFSALHISDYKIDFSPVSGSPFDPAPFLSLGDKGLTCLIADSTNAFYPGFIKGEKRVSKALDKIFSESRGRIFFTTFASNAERLGSVIEIAAKHGRKVAAEGASLLKNMETARAGGFLKIPPDILVPRKAVERMQDDKICVIVTGSQGEQASVMSKIAKNDYAGISVRQGDTFIFSSRIIPGNEKGIISVMNDISARGGRCVTPADTPGVHASGHAGIEDMRLLLKLVRPGYLLPVHGEEIHMKKHKETALSCAMAEDRVIIVRNGDKCVFKNGLLTDIERIPGGKRYVDAKGGFILNSDELRDRKRLAFEGGVFVYAQADLKNGILSKDPIVSLMGFEADTGKIARFIKAAAEKELFEKFSAEGWRSFIAKQTKRYFKKNMGRRPFMSVIIGET